MKKILFFTVSCFCSGLVSAQNTESSSSFYDKPVGPVHSILFEYRPELFSNKKELNNFQRKLKQKCDSNHIVIFYAEMGNNMDDSLRNVVDFVCRAGNVNFKAPLSEAMTVPIIMGPSLKDKKSFSFLGFTNIYSGNPDWKCNCSIKSFETSQFDAVSCLFDHMIADGIIKQVK